MPPLSRRFLVLGSPLLLAGCMGSESGRLAEETPRKRQLSYYESMYAEVQDGPFVVPEVDLSLIDPEFLRQEVRYSTPERVGTVIVDPDNHFLYLVREGGMALRYGVGVGRDGFAWNGAATIQRKAKWPRWTPPADMVKRDPQAAKYAGGMPGGLANPLGARAHYLYQGNRDTLYRIHGTNEPDSIGKSMSSGCIRMLNQDVMHLFDQTIIGSKVVVLPSHGLRDAEPVVSSNQPPRDAYDARDNRERIYIPDEDDTLVTRRRPRRDRDFNINTFDSSDPG